MMSDENKLVIGRAEIAYRLGRSERTISRWARRGLLKVMRDGPFINSMLVATIDDIENVRGVPREDEE